MVRNGFAARFERLRCAKHVRRRPRDNADVISTEDASDPDFSSGGVALPLRTFLAKASTAPVTIAAQ